jgi:outer membrane protein OmpA-like peptidoglycan-associated protein
VEQPEAVAEDQLEVHQPEVTTGPESQSAPGPEVDAVLEEKPEIEARTPVASVDSEQADFADNIDVLPGDGIVAAVSEPTTAEVEEQEVEEAEYFRLPDPEVLVDFTFDSAELSQVSREALNPVAEFLGQNLGRSASIIAYSNSRRAENYNLELSRKRITSVAHYLIAGGASAGQLAVEVRGVPDEFDDVENNGAETLVDRRRIVTISVSGHNSL